MRDNIIVIQLGGKCCSYNFSTTSYLKHSANGSAMLDTSDQFRIIGPKWFMKGDLLRTPGAAGMASDIGATQR